MNNEAFNGDGLWIFALFLLFGLGGNGFGFGGNASRTASIEDLNAQTNATRIESMIQNNGNLTETKFDNLTKGLCDMGYSNMVAINNVEKNLTAQIGALSSKIDADKIASLTAQVSELKTAHAISNATNCIPKVNPYLYSITCGCNQF